MIGARSCGDGYDKSGMLTLINPVPRAEPFDDGCWLFNPSIQHTTRYTQLSAAPFKDFWR
jgi:hypothetical protein